MQHHSINEAVMASSVESLQLRLNQEYEARDALAQKYGALQKKCDDIESRLKECQARSQFLSNENSLLTTKLSEQINIRSKLQLSKEEMAEELEELTRSLFEEANELVSKEAKARHQTEAALSKALDELARLQVAFKDESSQLLELKERMKDMISTSGGNPFPSHLPRPFVGEPVEESSASVAASPIPFFLSSSAATLPACLGYERQQQEHLAAASSIWHYISWKGLQDVWPETFEEWKNVIYFKPLQVEGGHGLKRDPGKETHSDVHFHSGAEGHGHGHGHGQEQGREQEQEQEQENQDQESIAKTHLSTRRINPQWILEQLDSDLYVEFLHWLGRSSVPEPQYHAPLASSGSALSLPSLLIQPAEFTSRPSTPQKTPTTISTSRPSSYSMSQEIVKQLSSSSSSASSDPFMRRAWEEDVLPTLSFPLRSKSFSKKLMKSIASNSVSIEAVLCPPRPPSLVGPFPFAAPATTTFATMAAPASSTVSHLHATPMPQLATSAHFTTSPLSNHSYSTPLTGQLPSTFVSPSGPSMEESFASPPPMPSTATWIPIKDANHSPKTAFARLAPGASGGGIGSGGSSALSDSPRSDIHDFIERARTASPDPSLNGTVCSLCGRPIRPLPARLAEAPGLEEPHGNEPLVHRLRLSDDESSASSLLIDSHCRSKIVSVCDFFSFVRYYRQGFYTSFTNEHLYAHWLQLKRAMMYARTGSTSYFVASDVSLLMRRWHQGWYDWCSTEAQKHLTQRKLAKTTTLETTTVDAAAVASTMTTLAIDKRSGA